MTLEDAIYHLKNPDSCKIPESEILTWLEELLVFKYDNFYDLSDEEEFEHWKDDFVLLDMSKTQYKRLLEFVKNSGDNDLLKQIENAEV